MIMKKRISGRDYDTDASELVMKKTFGNFGDPWGYEETLYKTADGKFFIYGFGGINSPYPQETMIRLAAEKVEAWKESRQ